MEVALGIDIGTGSTKAGLVDAEGSLVAVARRPHRPLTPRPGWSEADPQVWLDAARSATAAVVAAAAADGTPVEVVALGFSGQMHGVVLCGPDLQPLRPAVLWSDRRSEPDLADLRARLGPVLLARLANPVVAGMAGSTLAALSRLEPDLIDRVRVALQPKDWLRAQLTGEVATEPTDASATLLWDVVADRWSDEACAAFGVDPAWLAPVIASTSPAGGLLASPADRFGL
ncbi:MAG: FGGY family carbohydrate kinase, partial [Actinomycetota bacterium]